MNATKSGRKMGANLTKKNDARKFDQECLQLYGLWFI